MPKPEKHLSGGLKLHLCLTIVLGLIGMIAAVALADEITDRQLISIPSGTTTSITTDVTIPPGSDNHGSFSGNTLIVGTDLAASNTFAKSINKIDLTAADYQFVFHINTSVYDNDALGDDYGSAFILFNDDSYLPQGDSDYGALGIYGTSGGARNAETIHNAVAVEFDNYKRTQSLSSFGWYDAVTPDIGTASHVAITTPINATSGSQIIHEATGVLPQHYANNTTNTVKIEWKLTNAGATSDLTDNYYTLTYYYYQGADSAAGSPTVSGSKTFSYSQMLAQFGGTSLVNYGWSGSTGSLIGNEHSVSYVATYPYTVNYHIQLANGTNTNIAVPGSTATSGSAPLGTFDVKPLPTFTNYTLAPNQSTAVNIGAAGNDFIYYYIDAAPIITGADAISINQGTSFDPLAGVSASDIVDGPITTINVVPDPAYDSNVPGVYTFQYSVTDSVGNVTTVDRQVTVLDTVKPDPPTINTVMEMVTQITGTGEAGTTVYVRLPSNAEVYATVDSLGAWSVNVTEPLLVGQTITAWLVDAALNQSDSTITTVQQVFLTLTINKVWSDSTNPTTYPDLTFNVYQDGSASVYTSFTLTHPNLSIVDSASLPRYNAAANGQPYTYTVEEAAHADYSSSFTIDVNDAGVLTYTFTNQRLATLRVTKTGTNNAALDGVVFELHDAAGGLLDTQTTAGGLAQFAYLEVGETYSVREIKTISGYQLNEEVLTFTVDAANLVIDRTIVNYERIDELPATGTPARLVLWLCGGVLILSFFVRTVLMRKRGIY